MESTGPAACLLFRALTAVKASKRCALLLLSCSSPVLRSVWLACRSAALVWRSLHALVLAHRASRSSDGRLGLANGESAARPPMDLDPASECDLTVSRGTSTRARMRRGASALTLLRLASAPLQRFMAATSHVTCLHCLPRGACSVGGPDTLCLPRAAGSCPAGFALRPELSLGSDGSWRPTRDPPGLASPRLRCALRFSQPLGAFIPSLPLRPCLMPVSLMGFTVLQRFSLHRRRRRSACA
jgi:hypothetical protein